MKLVVGESKRPYVLEPGVMQATMTRIDDVGNLPDKFNPGKTKHKYAITFEVDRQYKSASGELKNMSVDGLYTLTLDERSNFYKLVCALLNRKLTIGEEVDPDTLLGSRCMLVIKNNDKKFPVIDGVLPVIEGLPPMKAQNLPAAEWIMKRVSPATSNSAMR